MNPAAPALPRRNGVGGRRARFYGLVLGASVLLAALAAPDEAVARRNGLPVPGCDGCHQGEMFDGGIELFPTGELVAGSDVRFRLTISDSRMQSAGFFINTEDDLGALRVIDGTDVAFISDYELVQSRPNPATSGSVVVDFSWTVPTEPGGTSFRVFVVGANDNRQSTGDSAAAAAFVFTWGCDPITLYQDVDGDGFGVPDQRRPDCVERPGWAALDGDCNDVWASIYPGATELGNGKDDDCDGDIDEGVDLTELYPDRDGDGYGDSFAEPVPASQQPLDHVPNAADCDDSDPMVSPDAQELCDGVDNDCDLELDEGTYQYCGVGVCSRRVESCVTACVPGLPEIEICNGLDDDCDGEVDEAVECPAGQVCQVGCRDVALVESAEPDPLGAVEPGNTGESTSEGSTRPTVGTNVGAPEQVAEPPDATSAAAARGSPPGAEPVSAASNPSDDPSAVSSVPGAGQAAASCGVELHRGGIATRSWAFGVLASALLLRRRRSGSGLG